MTEHEWLAQAAPYAVGALDGSERAAFEAHLAGCAVCQAEVRSFREVAGRLADAVPPVEPAPWLRERVVAETRRRTRAPRLPWLAAAAAVVVAVGASTLALRSAGRARALEARLAVQDSLIDALMGPEVRVVSLASTGREPSLRVFWNHRRQRFIVTAFDLPAAPAGRTYQLWAIAKGTAPMSMGTFNTDAGGRARLVLPVAATITALGLLDLCGLTQEPVGGSPQPTETPRLLGSWRHTD